MSINKAQQVKVIDNHDRSKLGEGRSWGMGFAVCKKTDDDTYETVMPTSACREYLNDVIWSEIVDKKSSAWGLYYTPTGIFKNGEKLYLHINMLRQNHTKPEDDDKNWFKRAPAYKILEENIDNVLALMHHVEDQLGIEEKTIISPTGNEGYLFEASPEWRVSTYATSLYTLLVRMAQYYDGKVSPHKYLMDYQHNTDSALWNDGARVNYQFLTQHKRLPVGDMGKINGPHSYGICVYKPSQDAAYNKPAPAPATAKVASQCEI